MTGNPNSISTRNTLAFVERHARTTKKAVWKDLVKRLKRAHRNRTSVNLWKLDMLAKKFKGKIFVVPGKVLGKGNLNEKVTVIALEYSETARAKINSKGTALSFDDAVQKKVAEKELVIVQ
jgi:large subunit ribosomal protein L18e